MTGLRRLWRQTPAWGKALTVFWACFIVLVVVVAAVDPPPPKAATATKRSTTTQPVPTKPRPEPTAPPTTRLAPKPTVAPTRAPTTTKPTNPPKPPPTTAPSQGITLEGERGEKIVVTGLGYVDPAAQGNAFEPPSAGNRFYAVKLQYTNVGSVPYNDSVLSELTVTDASNYSYEPSLFDSGAGPPFPGDSVKLMPGETAVGFVTFEVPTASKIVRIQCTLDSGFGPRRATWTP